jgi:hypothetical protein
MSQEITKAELRDLYESITRINEKTARILFILESDDKTNQKGLVEDVSILKKEVEQLILEKKILNTKIVTTTGFLVILGSAVSWVATEIYKHFVK